MKDIAFQAYVQYLQEVIQKHEEVNDMKDQMISTLKERIETQTELINVLQSIIDNTKALKSQ